MIITYPIVFLTKIIFQILEFVLWSPFELLSIKKNNRISKIVKLRKLSSKGTSIKTYRPNGFFGAPDRFFLKRKLENSNWIFYTVDGVKNAFESNIKITNEMRVYQTPEWHEVNSEEGISIEEFNNWYPVINTLKSLEINVEENELELELIEKKLSHWEKIFSIT